MSATVGKGCAVSDSANNSASTQRGPQSIRSEAQLEAAIAAASQRMCAAPDRTLKMQYWREMCRLIDQRTPHRVRFMERMRGL